ncbi:Tetratricopeptide repeat-containing protein [Duganella sp. CF517]|uniref:tetratricopeptide repeat protein n=1 Tax=Duganella sp. CF517 TaxID=1881038 RepID=UPI0008BD7D82|nr:tetratricopeptide repeat protein [Duganella sp. CF517]SEN68340.1 Tetratricopeptide repeat-containing protein [Duganella sp. CF517]
MKPWAMLWCAVAFCVSGCASHTAAQRAPLSELFHDQLFQAPAAPIDTTAIFAVSERMRDYLKHNLVQRGAGQDPRRALFDALYTRDQLKLEYDSAMTRNAAETFDARAGNCLSLVIMTAALARELNFTVQFQQIQMDESWSRSGNLYFAANHVNLMLGKKRTAYLDGYQVNTANALTVDFIPIPPKARESARLLEEHTIVAMYLNNRAAELLSAGSIDDAYWAARQAVQADPGFMNGYNTLAVIYQNHGNPMQAEQTLRYALRQAPDNTIYLSNLAQTLESLQRPAEAAAVRERLARLEPFPPFHFFRLGLEAVELGDYQRARNLFERELERSPDYHEFHYWLAVTHYQLGNLRAADKHMRKALENSTTRGQNDLYAAKLDRIRAHEAKVIK